MVIETQNLVMNLQVKKIGKRKRNESQIQQWCVCVCVLYFASSSEAGCVCVGASVRFGRASEEAFGGHLF